MNGNFYSVRVVQRPRCPASALSSVRVVQRLRCTRLRCPAPALYSVRLVQIAVAVAAAAAAALGNRFGVGLARLAAAVLALVAEVDVRDAVAVLTIGMQP